jgi:hypothetical protein
LGAIEILVANLKPIWSTLRATQVNLVITILVTELNRSFLGLFTGFTSNHLPEHLEIKVHGYAALRTKVIYNFMLYINLVNIFD